jgi:hypothetical protein
VTRDHLLVDVDPFVVQSELCTSRSIPSCRGAFPLHPCSPLQLAEALSVVLGKRRLLERRCRCSQRGCPEFPLFPVGLGRTTDPENFTSPMDDLERKVFGQPPDQTWIHPGNH